MGVQQVSSVVIPAGEELTSLGVQGYEQGCEQCQIWTGRAAPRSDIAASLCSALFSEASSHPAREKMEPIAEIPQALAEQLGPPRRGAGWGSPALVMTAAAGIAVVAAIAAQRRLKR